MIPLEKWALCRSDYVTGKGSLCALALRHGINRGTVERRAGTESWSRLRQEYAKRELERLLPGPPPVPQMPPAVEGGAISERWLKDRQELHFRETARFVDLIRASLERRINSEESPSPDTIRSQAAALNHLAEIEARLLGLRNKNAAKRGEEAPKAKKWWTERASIGPFPCHKEATGEFSPTGSGATV